MAQIWTLLCWPGTVHLTNRSLNLHFTHRVTRPLSFSNPINLKKVAVFCSIGKPIPALAEIKFFSLKLVFLCLQIIQNIIRLTRIVFGPLSPIQELIWNYLSLISISQKWINSIFAPIMSTFLTEKILRGLFKWVNIEKYHRLKMFANS